MTAYARQITCQSLKIPRDKRAMNATKAERQKKEFVEGDTPNDIDDAVKSAKSFDEFLQIMELEKDYKIARRGKYLRLHPSGYDENTYFRLGSKLGKRIRKRQSGTELNIRKMRINTKP